MQYGVLTLNKLIITIATLPLLADDIFVNILHAESEAVIGDSHVVTKHIHNGPIVNIFLAELLLDHSKTGGHYGQETECRCMIQIQWWKSILSSFSLQAGHFCEAYKPVTSILGMSPTVCMTVLRF